jgi:nicotinamidase/pyrazinamidase
MIYVEKGNTAALDVDAMNCFTPKCPNELAVRDGDNIVQELNAQAKKAGYRALSKDAHPANAYWRTDDLAQLATPVEGAGDRFQNMDLKWFMHGVPGTFGFEVIEGLPQAENYDFLVYKGVERDMHPYGACYHDLAEKIPTGIIEWLRDKKIETVIVGGLATDYCVRVTVLQLLRAGFRVIVNLGACRGIAENTVNRAIAAMQEAGAEFVQTAEEIGLHK